MRRTRMPAAPGLIAVLSYAAACAGLACTLPPSAEGWQHAAAAGGAAAGATELAFRMQPSQPAVGQLFALDVRLCPARARLVAVDATMPEHKHGMNYRPSVRAAARAPARANEPAAFRVDGMAFHMPGHWRLRFDVTPASPQAPYGEIEASYQQP
jgi:hypothetical protein